MSIKLISVDVDGTLIDERKQSHPDVGLAIQEALAKGIHVCLNSGRSLRELSFIIERFGIPGPYICCNGGVIHDGHSILHGDFLEPSVVRDFFAFGREHGANMYFTTGSDTYFCSPAPILRTFSAVEVVETAAIEEMIAAGTPFCMVALHADDLDRFNSLYTLWKTLAPPGLTNAKTYRTILGITREGVHKGAAMLELGRIMGISREEILAIGDNENDVEMLALAGIGVAMAEAPEFVQKAADIITGTVHEGGAAEAIRRYALGG